MAPILLSMLGRILVLPAHISQCLLPLLHRLSTHLLTHQTASSCPASPPLPLRSHMRPRQLLSPVQCLAIHMLNHVSHRTIGGMSSMLHPTLSLHLLHLHPPLLVLSFCTNNPHRLSLSSSSLQQTVNTSPMVIRYLEPVVAMSWQSRGSLTFASVRRQPRPF